MTTCYCRRCLIHDDPGGCLVVERAMRSANPTVCFDADDECNGAVHDGLCGRHRYEDGGA